MSIFARLHRFTNEETQLYVKHRLRVAGCDFKSPLFTPEAEVLIARYSGGVPRIINNICFNAISLGAVLKQKTICEEVVRECLDDLELGTEAAGEKDDAVAGSKRIATIPTNPATLSRSPFPWQRGLAFCFMFLLCFICGRQSPQTVGSHSAVAASASSQSDALQRASVLAVDRPSPIVPSVERDLSSTLAPVVESLAVRGTFLSISTQKLPRPHSRLNVEETSDPAKLWEQVKNQNTDAELELARLYREGTAVPQNCAQAEMLLLAASGKGNARATDLLHDWGNQCR
jgi:hypothetical protein